MFLPNFVLVSQGEHLKLLAATLRVKKATWKCALSSKNKGSQGTEVIFLKKQLDYFLSTLLLDNSYQGYITEVATPLI